MTAASAVSPSSHSQGPVTKHTGIRGARAPQTTGGRLGRGRGPGPLPRKENLSSAPTPGSAGGPEGHSPQPGGERQRVTAPSPGESRRARGSQPPAQGGETEGHSPQPKGERQRVTAPSPGAQTPSELEGGGRAYFLATYPFPFSYCP